MCDLITYNFRNYETMGSECVLIVECIAINHDKNPVTLSGFWQVSERVCTRNAHVISYDKNLWKIWKYHHLVVGAGKHFEQNVLFKQPHIHIKSLFCLYYSLPQWTYIEISNVFCRSNVGFVLFNSLLISSFCKNRNGNHGKEI